jgi:hypothetical protein
VCREEDWRHATLQSVVDLPTLVEIDFGQGHWDLVLKWRSSNGISKGGMISGRRL